MDFFSLPDDLLLLLVDRFLCLRDLAHVDTALSNLRWRIHHLLAKCRISSESISKNRSHIELVEWASKRGVMFEELKLRMSELPLLFSTRGIVRRIRVETLVMVGDVTPQPLHLEMLLSLSSSTLTGLIIADTVSAELTNTLLIGFLMMTEANPPTLSLLELSECTHDQWTITHVLQVMKTYGRRLTHVSLSGCQLNDAQLHRLANHCQSLVELTIDVRHVSSIAPLLALCEGNPALQVLVLNSESTMLKDFCPITNSNLMLMLTLVPKLTTIDVMSPNLTYDILPKMFDQCQRLAEIRTPWANLYPSVYADLKNDEEYHELLLEVDMVTHMPTFCTLIQSCALLSPFIVSCDEDASLCAEHLRFIIKTVPPLHLTGLHAPLGEDVGDDDFAALLQRFPNLHDVWLYACPQLQQQSFRNIVQTTKDRIQFLLVRDNPHLTDSDVGDIVRQCGQLIHLHLSGCQRVTDEALRFAAQAGPQLLEVDLFNTEVTVDGVMRVIQESPDWQVSYLGLPDATLHGVMDLLEEQEAQGVPHASAWMAKLSRSAET